MTLTALVVLQMMSPAHTTHTNQWTSHPGQFARVNEIVSLIPVEAASHHAMRMARPKVM